MLILRNKLFAKVSKSQMEKFDKIQKLKTQPAPLPNIKTGKANNSVATKLKNEARQISNTTGDNSNAANLGNGEFLTSIYQQHKKSPKSTPDGIQLKITAPGELDPGYFPKNENKKIPNPGKRGIKDREVLVNGQVGEFEKTILKDGSFIPGYEKSYQTIIPGFSRYELAGTKIKKYRPGTKYRPL